MLARASWPQIASSVASSVRGGSSRAGTGDDRYRPLGSDDGATLVLPPTSTCEGADECGRDAGVSLDRHVPPLPSSSPPVISRSTKSLPTPSSSSSSVAAPPATKAPEQQHELAPIAKRGAVALLVPLLAGVVGAALAQGGDFWIVG